MKSITVRCAIFLCTFFLALPVANAELSEEEADIKAAQCLATPGCAKTSNLLFRTSSIVGSSTLVNKDASQTKGSSANLNDALSELGAEISDTEILITLENSVLFDFDQHNLKAEAILTLQKVLSVLKSKDLVQKKVHIEGHTDWIGSDEYNIKLSNRRANSVSSWLTKNSISKSRLVSVGKGEHEPVATNDTAEGRSKNRRVEIRIKKS